MSLYPKAGPSRGVAPVGLTEFEILKASHKFLREDEEGGGEASWGDQVAKKYYSSLYREFAICDLKHYKSGKFALRWRTEEEVLSGAGEETCGNSRCPFHERSRAFSPPPFQTVELPFVYEEQGETKSALVKVVLCERCLKKLMWKRNKEKEERKAITEGVVKEDGCLEQRTEDQMDRHHDGNTRESWENRNGHHKRSREDKSRERGKRHRSSRSRSPRSKSHSDKRKRSRSKEPFSS